jgi:hemerythrin-like domain-containing protein
VAAGTGGSVPVEREWRNRAKYLAPKTGLRLAPGPSRRTPMLTNIGKPTTPTGTLELLVECHERIRSFLALARRVADARSPDREDVRQAAARVSRYFSQALPLHAQDEERSILPRLHGRDPAVDVELETMRREHGEHEGPTRALVEACGALERAPERHAELAGALGEATAELERHFAAHLRREEEVIFPAVRRFLDPAADAQVVREIRARRGVADPAPPTDAPPFDAPAGFTAAAVPPGPIVRTLAADHLVLDALLSGALAPAGDLDRRAYDDFREGLLRHIAIEEKILLAAARDARGGEELPEARQLHVEHGALAALLVPTPTRELALEIRKILGPHNALEEEGGVYERCEALLAERGEDVLRRIRQYPGVKVAQYNDGPRVVRTAEEALRLSAMQSARRR